MIDWNDDIVTRITTHGKCSEISDINLHRVELHEKNIIDVTFKSCDFRGAFITSTIIERCNFINCSFVVANFCDCQLKQVVFSHSFMHGVHFIRSYMRNFDFISCNISNALFEDTTIEKGKVCDDINNIRLRNSIVNDVLFILA
jgi:uncharacterized protein YjbI with pentapeptide repeats